MSNKKVIAFIVGLILFDIVGIMLLRKPDKERTREDMYEDCYYYSQTLVKEQLKSPKSASFPAYNSSFVDYNGYVVKVSAYVDADNSFGASIRTQYVATIYVDENNEPERGTVKIIE